MTEQVARRRTPAAAGLSSRSRTATRVAASTDERRAVVRERLLAGARAEFTDFGFHGTDTNRIARRAGLGPATYYRYFPDKDATFRIVYSRWIDENWRRLGEIVGRGDPVDVTARRMARALVAHYRAGGGIRASIHALCHQSPDFKELYLVEGRKQLDVAAARRAARGLPRLPDEEHLAIFYVVERLADAIAFGETSGLGLRDERLQRPLQRVLAAYLRGMPLESAAK